MRSKTSGERRRMMRRYVERSELWCRCCARPMWFRGAESRSRFIGRWQQAWGSFREPSSAEIERSIATIDHLIPQSRNGTHHPRNLMLMCQACNADKAHMTPSEWIAHRAATGRALKKEIIAKLLKRERKAIRQIGGPLMIPDPPACKGEPNG